LLCHLDSFLDQIQLRQDGPGVAADVGGEEQFEVAAGGDLREAHVAEGQPGLGVESSFPGFGDDDGVLEDLRVVGDEDLDLGGEAVGLAILAAEGFEALEAGAFAEVEDVFVRRRVVLSLSLITAAGQMRVWSCCWSWKGFMRLPPEVTFCEVRR
jgi:hypothetical protein